MREVKVMGQVFEVRGMTRGELGKMKMKGYPVTRWSIDLSGLNNDEKAEQMFDEMLTRGCSPGMPLDLEDLTPAAERVLFMAIVAETFGSEDEEKNSSKSGRPDQTPEK